MQIRSAQALREQWGNKPCEHPQWEKEYLFGADTGDVVCTTCGKTMTAQAHEEWEGEQAQKRAGQ